MTTSWTGFPSIAIILFYYRYSEKFSYESVKKELLEGYGTIREVPDFSAFDLELLMTARTVNFLNYALLVYVDPKTDYFEKALPRVKKFMDAYL